MSLAVTYSRIKFELLGMLIYYLAVSALVLQFGLDYTVTAVLFMGIPSIYLSLKKPKIVRINLVYSLLFTLTLVPVLDYLGHVSGSWFEATGVSGVRILGVFPLDALLWGFLYSYFIISFYESYLDRHKTQFHVSRRVKSLVLILLSLALVFSALLLGRIEFPVVPYFYALIILLLFVVPITGIVVSHRQLLPKIVAQGIWFAVLSVIFELTALKAGHWWFPGSYYVASVNLFGLWFPFEEALWILLAVPAYICIYEYFADDGR